jgi:hypothetical protein
MNDPALCARYKSGEKAEDKREEPREKECKS